MNLMRHIGTKLVNLEPMTRQQYNEFRGWTVPGDEDPNDEGYLVEYLDGGKPNTAKYAGYVSWSPEAVADATYRRVVGMSLGLAIEAMRKGRSVSRADWEKRTYLFIVNGCNKLASAMGYGFGEYLGEPTFQDAVFLHTENAKLMPWTPTHADLLADDWNIVD